MPPVMPSRIFFPFKVIGRNPGARALRDQDSRFIWRFRTGPRGSARANGCWRWAPPRSATRNCSPWSCAPASGARAPSNWGASCSSASTGVAGMLAADLSGVKGLGPAKRAQFEAALELARRSLKDELRAASALTSPGAVRDYLRLAHRRPRARGLRLPVARRAAPRAALRGAVPRHADADLRLPAGNRQGRPARPTPPR